MSLRACEAIQNKFMIISKIIKTDKTTDNLEIERALRERGIDPVRWAVVAVEGEKFKINVSYETKEKV